MPSKRVGFFGGSFDPIHFGHINLALSLLEKGRVDEVVFCPANSSPFKEGSPPSASKEHRLEMVKLAIAPIKQFTCFDGEVKRPPPSYTIETINFLIGKHPGVQYFLILGEDSLKDLEKWKEIEKLVQLAPPLVGSRISSSLSLPAFLSDLIKKGRVETPVMEISATAIRERLHKGLFCGHLVPSKVLDYISQNHLYSF